MGGASGEPGPPQGKEREHRAVVAELFRYLSI